MMKQEFPAVELYTIGPNEVDRVASLLTAEAAADIKNGEAFGMTLVEEGEVRAAACARISPENDEVLELLSLYVAPAFCRRALGGTLLMELLEETMAATDGTLNWAVTTFMPDAEGMESLLAKAGFQMEQDEQVVSWRLPVADLADSLLLKHSMSVPAGCSLHTLEELSDYSLRQLVQELQKNLIADLTVAQMREALQTASYVLLDQKGQPKACAVVSKAGKNALYLSQFFAAGGNAPAAMTVLQAAGQAVLQQFPGNTVLEIPTLTETSANLVKKLLPSSQAVCLMRAVLELT